MTVESHNDASMPRRKFLRLSAATVGAVGGLGAGPAVQAAHTRSAHPAEVRTARAARRRGRRAYDGPYSGENLNQVAFPLGGIGAGLVGWLRKRRIVWGKSAAATGS